VPLVVLSPLSGLRAMHGLGIGGDTEFARDAINGALAGRRVDGEMIDGKVYAKVRNLPVDPKTGERRVSHPIGSYDFSTSADKSVSVAWAFAPPAEATLIFNAHIEATRAAQAFVIDKVAIARTGKGGAEQAIPGEVRIFEFTHHTGRRVQISTSAAGETVLTTEKGFAGDPDLHTHSLIPNAVFCADGRVGSLDTRQVGSFLKEGGSVYQATLAQKLRDAGFDVVLDERTGAARMPAIPDGIRDIFSKRTNAGLAAAKAFTAARGEQWDDLTPDQQATRMKVATQDRDQKIKGGKDDIADVADWKRQAQAVGWEPTSFMAYGPPAPELTHEQRIRMAYEAALPEIEDLFARKSVITHWELRTAVGHGLVHSGLSDVSDYNDVTALMRREGVRQYGEMTALVWGQDDERRAIALTTALHEAQELEFVGLAKAAARDRSAALPGALLDRKIAESGLDFSGEHGKAQLAMIRRLGTEGRLSVGLAAAGAGKTAALQPLTRR
jgi:conjugative relaxase-like TrwC/TraI family protein